MLVAVERTHHIATCKVQMARIRREPEKLGIGHGHKTIDLVLVLNHLAHVVVQSRREAHLPAISPI